MANVKGSSPPPTGFRLGGLALPTFAALIAQLALVLLVVQVFRIEQVSGFMTLLPVLFGGFIIHAVLPKDYRQPFFVLLTFVATIVLMGWTGLWLIGIGLGLIGLCHLPIAFGLRVALVVAAGVVLGLINVDLISTEWGGLVVPILGAIFMFRLAIYLYDIRHERKKPPVWTRLSYFFMLPNLTFPLFPVVDYQTWKRTYYDKPSAEIYQKGILWMLRGVTHLIAYRLIYYYLVPSPSAVVDLAGVAQYMVATYLLYLRISGQFHLIVGILCLFGYNLPETHHLYYLASSFSDYWRRINIYWKDFMMKLFYYPVFMRLRKRGMTFAIGVATVVVFFGTWILHSYQWFWLRGTFPLTGPDAAFWGILGGLVVINSIWEVTRGRKRTLSTKKTWQLREAALYAAKVVGMFVLITVLWTLWSSPNLAEFGSMLVAAATSPLIQWVWAVVLIAGLIGLGVVLQYLNHKGYTLTLTGQNPSFSRSMAYTFGVGLALILVARTEVQQLLSTETAAVLASLQEDRFNQRDQDLLDRGYYEALLDTPKFTSQLWQSQTNMPPDWKTLPESGVVAKTDGFFRYEIIPNQQTPFRRTLLSANRWGMRDQDYPKAKPDGTFRFALLGASYEMGSGVEDDQAFEAVVERQLNDQYDAPAYDRFEVLNFAVGGYSVLQHVALLEQRVFEFSPDVVLIAQHSGSASRAVYILEEWIADDIALPPALQAIADAEGLTAEMPLAEIRSRLDPEKYGQAVLEWGYARIAELCRARGAVPIWLFVPRTDGIRHEETAEASEAVARAAGMMVFNMNDAYGDHNRQSLRLAPWDAHPNAEGHTLLAQKLYALITEHEDALGLLDGPLGTPGPADVESVSQP